MKTKNSSFLKRIDLVSLFTSLIRSMSTFLLCAMLLIGAYDYYDQFRINSKASLSYGYANPFQGGSLDQLSHDAIGYLTIDDSKISFPIMQSDDNTTYLNTAPDGSFSLSGSIFLDYRNDAAFLDPYAIIYGHHMDRQKMFGMLDAYLDEDYLNNHRQGAILLRDGTLLSLRVFASLQIHTSDTLLQPQTPLSTILEAIKNQAQCLSDLPDQNVIALSTCTSEQHDLRTMVFVTIEKRIEPSS